MKGSLNRLGIRGCTHTVRRGYAESTHITLNRTLKLVSHSFLVRYELVLGSFEVRYQFVMSSLDCHIRRSFPAYVRVSEIYFIFAIR